MLSKEYKYAEVIVDIAHSNIDRVFDYIVPADLDFSVGSRVLVPFGRTTTEGIVTALKNETDCPPEKQKEIIRTIDEYPVVTVEQMQLAKYVAYEYHSTMAFVLRLMFPAAMRGERIKERTFRMIRIASEDIAKAERARCFTASGEVRAKNKLKTIDKLIKEPMPSVMLDGPSVRKLIESGAAEEYYVSEYRKPYETGEEKISLPDMNYEQTAAVSRINAHIDSGECKTVLLHGVTGSGKTLVYMECVRHVLQAGKSAMVLVPEIALAPQLFTQFKSEFGDNVAVYHSALSDGERFDEWRRIREGAARIVLGARSAVFMPLTNIGIIILDEEHAESYKADNHPEYNAAVVARMRTQIGGGTLVLASATPLVEDFLKAKTGIYDLIELKHRATGIRLPKIEVIDMKPEYIGGNTSAISRRLHDAIADVLGKNEQAVLFLNRRGFASSLICPTCGHVKMCTHCDVPLKYHKSANALVCHYCGRTFPLTHVCDACGDDRLVQTGVGTEQLDEQVHSFFPGVRTLRMDFDTTRKKDSHLKIYESFKNHEADILIGTQMIARGLDFGNVTLAAIISADSLLNFGGYRSEENTFSMIEQVGGRAGRKKNGRVIVQTFNPENYAIIRASHHDYAGFYRDEMQVRKLTQKPPYSRMFRFVFSHKNKDKAKSVCDLTEKAIDCIVDKYRDDVISYIAKEAPVEKLDGVYRYHIILNVLHNMNTKLIKQELVKVWTAVIKKGVSIGFETDPNDIN